MLTFSSENRSLWVFANNSIENGIKQQQKKSCWYDEIKCLVILCTQFFSSCIRFCSQYLFEFEYEDIVFYDFLIFENG